MITMTRRRWYALFTACIIAGVVAGAAWPPPPLPKSNEGAGDWTLPQAGLERVPADALAGALKVRWSGENEDRAEGVVAAWRLAGILQAPQSIALISVGAGSPQGASGKQSLRLEPGGTLPDGSSLLAIENDTITIDRDGCSLTYQLHRPQPIRASGACGAADPATEQRKSQ